MLIFWLTRILGVCDYLYTAAEAGELKAKYKQVKIEIGTHRRLCVHLNVRDMIGDETVPHKQDFVSDAVDEKIDREEAKAARRLEQPC